MSLKLGLIAFWATLTMAATGAAPAAAQALEPCPPGRQWNPRLQRCLAMPACPPGSDWSPRLKRCVSPDKKCGPGMVWAPGQGCRPLPPPPPTQPRGSVTPPPPPEPRFFVEPSGLPAQGTAMVVQASALNLRDCPTRRCRARGILASGEEVRFLDYRHGYALVRVSADNREGWVDYRYLAPAP